VTPNDQNAASHRRVGWMNSASDRSRNHASVPSAHSGFTDQLAEPTTWRQSQVPQRRCSIEVGDDELLAGCPRRVGKRFEKADTGQAALETNDAAMALLDADRFGKSERCRSRSCLRRRRDRQLSGQARPSPPRCRTLDSRKRALSHTPDYRHPTTHTGRVNALTRPPSAVL
jgi:hypothetical protein